MPNLNKVKVNEKTIKNKNFIKKQSKKAVK